MPWATFPAGTTHQQSSRSAAVTFTLLAAGLLTLLACNEPSATAAEPSSDAVMLRRGVSVVYVRPDTATLGVGATIQLSVRLVDRYGRTLTGRAVTWKVSDTTVAVVSNVGLLLGRNPGTATVTATSEGRTGSARVTVGSVPRVPVASVAVTPASASLTVGQTSQLTATPRDASGSALTGRVISWSSTNVLLAAVSTTGLVTALGAGPATITATSEGRSGTAAVVVINAPSVPVASVVVAPVTASVNVGQTVQLTATLRDASGGALAGRVTTWSSSNTGVATVSATGLVTGVSAGPATITVASEGRSASSAVSVMANSDGSNFALQVYGNVLNDQGRVKIRLDDPATTVPGPPADIGATDITIEFWLRGRAADNTKPLVACGAGEAWIDGNFVLDRDRYSKPRDYGISLLGGRVAFGVNNENGSFTLCGTSSVLDNQWHHIAVTRRVQTGELQLFVDGARQAVATGPSGDISYPDNGIPGNFCGGACTNSDPYLVIGAEKHSISMSYPGFNGAIDELRLSSTVRYASAFQRPGSRFTTDGATSALYHFDEGSGLTVIDVSGAPGGPTNGSLKVGGSPAGPQWIVSDAPTGP